MNREWDSSIQVGGQGIGHFGDVLGEVSSRKRLQLSLGVLALETLVSGEGGFTTFHSKQQPACQGHTQQSSINQMRATSHCRRSGAYLG